MDIRLNKLLAHRGLGSRRACDALIAAGAVRVNGVIVRELGTLVTPERDRIEVHGRPIPGVAALRYFAFHKPVGVISTLSDPQGRRTIREFLPPGPRVYPVGRLDADTSGLLILTNDGDLAHHLMHPRYGVEKHYRVRVDREPDERQLGRLSRGVRFEPGRVSAPARVRVIARDDDSTVLGLSIHEGRYRQVRRMCEAVGLNVLKLHRSGYGPVRLGPVERGMWRELSDEEVSRLRAASARPRARPAAPRLTRFDRMQRVAAGVPRPIEREQPRGRPSTEPRTRGSKPRRLPDRGRPSATPRTRGANERRFPDRGRPSAAPRTRGANERRFPDRGRPGTAPRTRGANERRFPDRGRPSAAPRTRGANERRFPDRGRPSTAPRTRGANERRFPDRGRPGAAPRSRGPSEGRFSDRGRPSSGPRSRRTTERGFPGRGRPSPAPGAYRSDRRGDRFSRSRPRGAPPPRVRRPGKKPPA